MLNTRLFFCINPGRSGSMYLSELLGTAKEVRAYHEAEPAMTGAYLRMVHNMGYPSSYEQREIKSKKIKKLISTFKGQEIYCETNHMFIKTFFDVVTNCFKNLEVLILRRELSSVLKSFIELKYFTKKNEIWPDWMSLPNSSNAATIMPKSFNEMDQYEKCIAYLIDIEARAQRFVQNYPEIKCHNLYLELLNNQEDVLELFNELKITATSETEKILNLKKNEKTNRKQYFNNPTTLAYCKRRINIYLSSMKEQGIEIPSTLAFKE